MPSMPLSAARARSASDKGRFDDKAGGRAIWAGPRHADRGHRRRDGNHARRYRKGAARSRSPLGGSAAERSSRAASRSTVCRTQAVTAATCGGTTPTNTAGASARGESAPVRRRRGETSPNAPTRAEHGQRVRGRASDAEAEQPRGPAPGVEAEGIMLLFAEDGAAAGIIRQGVRINLSNSSSVERP